MYNIKIKMRRLNSCIFRQLSTVTYLSKNLEVLLYTLVHNISIPADGTSGLIIIKDSATGCEISRKYRATNSLLYRL
ncbi:MAG: hypothetical protein IPJ39_19685 [Saprospiraceae bacterium]|nr:hypothetical protein [Saprospiraceae bacterium]